jgi:DNA-binding MarR family transcriptional regulator
VSRTKLAADAWGSVLRAHAALVPRMDRILLDEAGIPLRWYDVLLELSDEPDSRLTLGALSDRVVLSRTRVSRVVDELVDSGLVRREANDEDGRSSYAVLTAAGRRTYDAAAPIYRRTILDLFASGLSDAQLRTIRDALGGLTS